MHDALVIQSERLADRAYELHAADLERQISPEEATRQFAELSDQLGALTRGVRWLPADGDERAAVVVANVALALTWYAQRPEAESTQVHDELLRQFEPTLEAVPRLPTLGLRAAALDALSRALGRIAPQLSEPRQALLVSFLAKNIHAALADASLLPANQADRAAAALEHLAHAAASLPAEEEASPLLDTVIARLDEALGAVVHGAAESGVQTVRHAVAATLAFPADRHAHKAALLRQAAEAIGSPRLDTRPERGALLNETLTALGSEWRLPFELEATVLERVASSVDTLTAAEIEQTIPLLIRVAEFTSRIPSAELREPLMSRLRDRLDAALALAETQLDPPRRADALDAAFTAALALEPRHRFAFAGSILARIETLPSDVRQRPLANVYAQLDRCFAKTIQTGAVDAALTYLAKRRFVSRLIDGVALLDQRAQAKMALMARLPEVFLTRRGRTRNAETVRSLPSTAAKSADPPQRRR